MDLTKEAIEKIESLVDARSGLDVEINGRHYSARDLKPVIFEPRPEPIEVSTLSGFAAYIRANRDKVALDGAIVLIETHDKVSLLSAFGGDRAQRTRYIQAQVDRALKVYPFEKYMEVEAFVVSLRSMFEPTEDLERVIRYVSKVKGGAAFSLDDDGISQTASVQVGVSGGLTGKETAPAVVKLRPFRTFRDIVQPESEFLFRMKLINTEERIVGCALFEADGGRWRNQALADIREHLVTELPAGLPVIA